MKPYTVKCKRFWVTDPDYVSMPIALLNSGVSDTAIRLYARLREIARPDDETSYEANWNLWLDPECAVQIRELLDGDWMVALREKRGVRFVFFADQKSCRAWQGLHQTVFTAVYSTSLQRTPGYVYLVKSPTGNYKIGKTRDINDRMKTFSVKLPFEVEVLHQIRCADHSAVEGALHEFFVHYRVNGEWFKFGDQELNWITSLRFDEQAEYTEPGAVVYIQQIPRGAMMRPALKGQ